MRAIHGRILAAHRSIAWQRPILIAVVALHVIACDQGITAGIAVDNKTPLELHFSVLLDRTWYSPVAHAHPNGTAVIVPVSILPASGCTTGGLIALADDGREIARHDRPMCVGDTWTIDTVHAGRSNGPSPSA